MLCTLELTALSRQILYSVDFDLSDEGLTVFALPSFQLYISTLYAICQEVFHKIIVNL